MSKEFILEPQVGTNSVRFNMTPDEVAQVLGPPESVGVNGLGERDEQRGSVGVRYSCSDKGVVELAFGPDTKLLYKGKNLFDEPDVIRFLTTWDRHPVEWVGFIIFLDLGITATGFHDGNDSQKAFTLFRKGRWDDFKSEFKPYSPPG